MQASGHLFEQSSENGTWFGTKSWDILQGKPTFYIQLS